MLLLNIDHIPGREIEALGADAVVNVRFGSSAIMQGAAEVVAYGTAVRCR